MNATLFVLHILKPSRPPVTQADVDACLAEERSARDRLSAACHDVLDGLSHELLTRTGDPAIAIIRAEEELKVDLVVLATHVSNRKSHAFAGSVAERVVRESICPVLTVRPSADGDPDAVGTHMTAAPLTTSPEATVVHVRQMMNKHRMRSLPVLENARVVGIVTERDLASDDVPDSTAIGLLMTREVISISPRASLQEAARLLFECEVNALPVIDQERLVGVITRSDVLKAFADIEA